MTKVSVDEGQIDQILVMLFSKKKKKNEVFSPGMGCQASGT